MASVSLQKVSKRYGGVSVIEGLDLEVRDGELMVLVGPSGCGKSTVLRMIAGLEDISGGTVSIGGRAVNGLAPKDRDISMVFHNYALCTRSFASRLESGSSTPPRSTSRTTRSRR